MHQPLPARVEDLKRKACQSDKQVTLTTTKGYKRKRRQWRCYCRPPLPNSFLMHLLATTSSQTASEFLHWFITFSQPPLVFSLHLDPSLSLTPLFIFFFPAGHDRLSSSPHSFLMVCSRQMEKLMITIAKASFAALNNRNTEKCSPQKSNPNLSLHQAKQFGLPVQYMYHLHFQNSVPKATL